MEFKDEIKLKQFNYDIPYHILELTCLYIEEYSQLKLSLKLDSIIK